MQYDNTNTGMLRRNQNKQKDNHPDYRGKINVNGTEFWLSAWIKVGREGTKLAGEKYMSLSVQPMEEQPPRHFTNNAKGYPRRSRDDGARDVPRRSTSRDDSEFGRDEIPF